MKRRYMDLFSPVSMTGVTLVELMMVVAIAGVLMGIAIPAYQNMVQDNCLVTNANLLVGSLQLARSEAVKTGRNTTIRPAVTQAAAIQPAGGWQNGWTITRTAVGNEPGVAAQGQTTVRTVNLSCVNTTITATANNFVYNARGTINGQGGTFTICDGRTGETGRQVVITAIGRPQSGGFSCQ